MAGLYFHIPFCRRLCGYCDFKRSADLRLMPAAIARMETELEEQSDFISDRLIKTIYFGGGTPSLLNPSQIERFIARASQLFDCSAIEEMTVEVNPDDVSEDYAIALHSIGVNRVSMGVQSFCDEELQFMGRRHSADDAVHAVERLQRAGFDNISIDLIFGVDGFATDPLRRSLQQATSLGVQHISAYHLTIEPQTRFGRLLAKGELRQVDEEQSEAEFAEIHRTLVGRGFEHYEVSNYALPGYRSRHNSSYWHGDQYLGIGAGAHSFNGQRRRWCEQSAAAYVQGIEYGEETLSEQDRMNERIMTSLRCAEGLSLTAFARNFGKNEADRIEQIARGQLQQLLIEEIRSDGQWLRIPSDRFMLSDMVIAELFKA